MKVDAGQADYFRFALCPLTNSRNEPEKWASSTFKTYNSYLLPISQTQIDLTNWTNNLVF